MVLYAILVLMLRTIMPWCLVGTVLDSLLRSWVGGVLEFLARSLPGCLFGHVRGGLPGI